MGLACLAEHPQGTTACDFPLASDPLLSTYREALRDAVARHPGVTLLDPTSWICPDGTCPALIDGVRVHIDDNHVSEEFVPGKDVTKDEDYGKRLKAFVVLTDAALLRQVGLGVRGAA